MLDSLPWALCDTQGKLFVLSADRGYDSIGFIRTYMRSSLAESMDKEFSHVQWAGKAYIMSALEEAYAEKLTKCDQPMDKEVLYWIGYLYRYWNLYTGESSKAIYKQAPAKTMEIVYMNYHSMSPEVAIDRLKDTYHRK